MAVVAGVVLVGIGLAYGWAAAALAALAVVCAVVGTVVALAEGDR